MRTCDRVTIVASSRIAVSLIGLSGEGYRINGGIGWAIDSPNLAINAVKSPKLEIKDKRTISLSEDEINGLIQFLERRRLEFGFVHAAHFELSGDLLPHRGLGAGTALRLALLESLFSINGKTASQLDLVIASSRGGTSGVGVRTYFEGGFVFDVGHKSRDLPRPSHAWAHPHLPLSLLRLDVPSWQFGICVPDELPSITHAEEKEFFQKTLPVPHTDVMQVLYHMVFGATAALAESDRTTFNQAIDALQETTWKAAERSRYGEGLLQVVEMLRNAGASGIGMSSLGPCLYFDPTVFDSTKIAARIRNNLWISNPSNSGRVIHRREGDET